MITSAANKQPNPEHWQYAELIPGPAVDNPPPPALASDFTDPIGGARSKTPPRSTTPQRTRFTQGRRSDPRYGSVPKSSSFLPPQQPTQPSAAAFGQPKRPPPPLPHTSQGNEVPNKTTQARAFHAPLISLLIQQLQAHAPAAAEGSALRALKATSDDLARAKEKLQAHGIDLTPRKEAGRSSAPSAPAAPVEPPAHKPPVLSDVL